MGVKDVIKVSGTDEFNREVEKHVRRGYVIQDRDSSKVFMQRVRGNLRGHTITALLTIWWTFGIGNAAYEVFCRMVKRSIMVKLEAQHVTTGGVWS